MTRRACIMFLLLTFVAAPLACAPSGVSSRPAGVSPQAREMSVRSAGGEGYEGAFEFGPYAVQPAPVAPAKAGQWTFMGLGPLTPVRKFAFSLSQEGEAYWQGQCMVGVVGQGQGLNLPSTTGVGLSLERGSRLALGCVFRPSQGKTWRMSLSTGGEGWALSGLLSDGVKTSILVKGSAQMGGRAEKVRPSLSRALRPNIEYVRSSASYAFELQDESLGGVRVAGRQAVWLGKNTPADALAVAAAALLVYSGHLKLP